ncbi:hypothetical protein [Saccharicrinis aurantiacus]|uniref:hypothetical protein n=1 Tax=Saccharicrinis aurantiacus TaxID=1849719 RepID=UPI002493BE0D|nr:hypothetical protein [Saccharicrinis aurantiacus]
MKFSLIANLFAIAIFSLTSCTKEKIINGEDLYSWKAHKDFQYENKILTNGYSDTSAFYASGPNGFYKVEYDKSAQQENFTNYVLINDLNIHQRTLITSEIIARTGEKGVAFNATKNPSHGHTYDFLSIPDIDSTCSRVCAPYYATSKALVMNHKNQCLIPYYSYSDGEQSSTYINAKFIITELSIINEYGRSYIEIANTVKLPLEEEMGSIRSLHSIGKYFFASCLYHTIRIDDEFKVDYIYPTSLVKIFEFNGKLYAFSDYDFLCSDDKGLNWKVLSSNIGNLHQVNYSVINGRLIGYYNSQILEFSLSDTEISWQYLVNDGLKGHKISSISFYNDKAYVTTLSGLFTKEYSDFFTYDTSNE